MSEELERLRSAEAASVRDRYSRRSGDFVETGPYHPVRADRLVSRQQKEREIARFLRRRWFGRISELRVLELGCASGQTLQMLFGLGIAAARTTGVDLLESRIAIARENLPPSCTLFQADAVVADLPTAEFDMVVQSTMFSSVLNETVRRALAERMVTLLASGGVILWYDLAYDNPANADVHGIGPSEIRALFPDCRMQFRRMTLAPFIGRGAARLGYRACSMLASVPFLRSHLLAWIEPESKKAAR